MTSRPPDLEMVELRDAVTTAERAVEHWQARLRAAVADVQALDGFVSWLLGMLSGSRQQQLDAAIQAVEQVQAKLARARQTRDEARARLATAEQDRVDIAMEQHAAQERREAVADVLRTAGHALTPRFNEVETALDALRFDMETMQHAYQAGMGLSAGLKSTLRRAQNPLDDLSPYRDPDAPRRMPIIDEAAMRRLASQAEAFEDACSTIGLSMSIHLQLPIRNRLGDFVRRFGHSMVVAFATQFESEQFVNSLESAIADTEGALTHLLHRLKALQAEASTLDGERSQLLAQFEGHA